jgi:hypothetical protein
MALCVARSGEISSLRGYETGTLRESGRSRHSGATGGGLRRVGDDLLTAHTAKTVGACPAVEGRTWAWHPQGKESPGLRTETGRSGSELLHAPRLRVLLGLARQVGAVVEDNPRVFERSRRCSRQPPSHGSAFPSDATSVGARTGRAHDRGSPRTCVVPKLRSSAGSFRFAGRTLALTPHRDDAEKLRG